jgi:sodium--glutamate symport carrier gltS
MNMRKLTIRDFLATVILVAVGVPYVGYLVRGEMPFIQDPRGMATVGLIGLILSFVAWGIGTHTTAGTVMALLGAVAVGLGLAAALIGVEGSEVLLAVFMGAIALVYLVETIYHALRGDPNVHTA